MESDNAAGGRTDRLSYGDRRRIQGPRRQHRHIRQPAYQNRVPRNAERGPDDSQKPQSERMRRCMHALRGDHPPDSRGTLRRIPEAFMREHVWIQEAEP